MTRGEKCADFFHTHTHTHTHRVSVNTGTNMTTILIDTSLKEKRTQYVTEKVYRECIHP